ncbi:PAS domain S-box protein [Geomonas sp. Red32]|uniref:PAS domain S-box protein n=1 Tax=Geomonas sp. Red32 TaxID=2912856 RepID=UPI00202CB017|nr:PAS domain S-box protein [Geomonas sp. Red32]
MPFLNRAFRFRQNIILAVVLSILLGISFSFYVRSEKLIDGANENRHATLRLAYELRQSSDDLTRLARTYVITGDPRYKQEYLDVLAIREGRKPRPEEYWRVYWDLVLDGKAPRPDSDQTIPLLFLMQQSGYRPQEFAKLAQAKEKSDLLARVELKAMKLAEGGGADAARMKDEARLMMYGQRYHEAKAAIMRPIDDLFAMVARRTDASVQLASQHALILRYLFIALTLCLVGTLWRVYRSLFEVLGGNPQELFAHIARMGRGDFSVPIPAMDDAAPSVMKSLGETQARLAQADTERKTSEAIKRQFYDIVHSSSDAIVGIDPRGRVTSWNPAAEKMYGYCEQDMLGEEIARVTPPDRVAEDQKMLARVQRGEIIGNFETVRLKKTGEAFPVSIGISPIKDGEGTVIGSSQIIRDISGVATAEAYRTMGQDILRLLNEQDDMRDAIQKIISLVKSAIGVDAVGIRLQDKEDYPYFYQEGFPQDFLLTENSVLTRNRDGGICRDECGNVCLECTCGLVLSGKPDPSGQFFTAGGSVWTNDTFPFLELPAEQDPRNHSRNECTHQGFASVALIPIKAKGSIVGLLQLNDRAKDRFTPEGIEILEDIAENIGEAMLRKQAEDALVTSEREFRFLAEAMPQIVWITRADGWNIYFNRQWADYTGLSLEESYGHGWNKPFHPDDQQRAWDAWHNAVATNGTYSLECRLRRHDGTYRWWLIRGVPALDDKGAISKWFGTCTDIEEIKQAENENARLAALLDESQHIAQVGGWEIDLANNHLYWTDETFRIHEISPAEYSPTIESALNFYAEESRPAITSAVEAALSSGTGFELELRLITAKGRSILVHTSSKVITKDGRPVKLIGAFRDITEQRHLEEQLRQSQKMEAVGQLAGGVAHDFNNILTVVSGYCHVLEMDNALNDQQRESIEQIISSSERAAQLTRALLAFSRKQVMVPKLVNLNDIIHNLHTFLDRVIGEDVLLRTICNETKLPVNVDTSQIEQVLINLATNARDAMQNGGSLTVESSRRQVDQAFVAEHGFGEPGQYACIAVSDTGCGMDVETRKKIFEPFYTTKEFGKGTGLGMAIVYGVVKQHNGFITVYSEPGQGTTFQIYLPLAEAGQTQAAESNVPEMPLEGTETILLAEDDASVRTLVVTILTKFGYRVIQAVDGDDVVQKFSEHRGTVDLILMDMIMPKKNGREAYEAISRMAPDVKVLYSSGYTADFIQNRGVSEEGIELVMKPVRPIELLRKVRSMLDRS